MRVHFLTCFLFVEEKKNKKQKEKKKHKNGTLCGKNEAKENQVIKLYPMGMRGSISGVWRTIQPSIQIKNRTISDPLLR